MVEVFDGSVDFGLACEEEEDVPWGVVAVDVDGSVNGGSCIVFGVVFKGMDDVHREGSSAHRYVWKGGVRRFESFF